MEPSASSTTTLGATPPNHPGIPGARLSHQPAPQPQPRASVVAPGSPEARRRSELQARLSALQMQEEVGGGSRSLNTAAYMKNRWTANDVSFSATKGKRHGCCPTIRRAGSMEMEMRYSSSGGDPRLRHLAHDFSLWGRFRFHVAWMVCSDLFDLLSGMVIVLNSIAFGVEQSWRLKGEDPGGMNVLEDVFLGFYCVELVCRYISFGPRAILDHWVQFDTLLVAVSVTSEWILGPVLSTKGKDLDLSVVLRMARLARLARMMKLLVRFRELWMLVRGFMVSANMMLYTMGLLFSILYVFAAIGVEIMTVRMQTWSDVDEDIQEVINEYFPNLPVAMLTLVQFLSLDACAGIYRPLIKEYWLLSIYFMAIILVVAIVLMNIITAVLVNGALEQANLDKEAMKAEEDRRRKRLMRALRDMFERLDEDGSGQVQREEFMHASEEDQVLLNEFCSVGDPLEIFNQLDIDGGGSLDIEEFCEGLYQAAISKTPIELKRVDKRMDVMKKQMDSLRRNMESIKDTQAKMYTALVGELVSDKGRARHGDGLKEGQTATPDVRTREVDREGTSPPASSRASTSLVPTQEGGPSPRREHAGASCNSPNSTTPRARLLFPAPARATSGDTPPWAMDLLLELQQLRAEVVDFAGSVATEALAAGAARQPRPPGNPGAAGLAAPLQEEAAAVPSSHRTGLGHCMSRLTGRPPLKAAEPGDAPLLGTGAAGATMVNDRSLGEDSSLTTEGLATAIDCGGRVSSRPPPLLPPLALPGRT